jgi:hypothetical protein
MSLIDLNKKYLHSGNKDHFRRVPELVQPELFTSPSLAQSAPNVPECTMSNTKQDSGKRPRIEKTQTNIIV